MSDPIASAGDLFLHEGMVGLTVFNQNGIKEFRMKEGYVFTILERNPNDDFGTKHFKVLMANTGKIHYILERDFDAWLSRKYIKKIG